MVLLSLWSIGSCLLRVKELHVTSWLRLRCSQSARFNLNHVSDQDSFCTRKKATGRFYGKRRLFCVLSELTVTLKVKCVIPLGYLECVILQGP